MKDMEIGLVVVGCIICVLLVITLPLCLCHLRNRETSSGSDGSISEQRNRRRRRHRCCCCGKKEKKLEPIANPNIVTQDGVTVRTEMKERRAEDGRGGRHSDKKYCFLSLSDTDSFLVWKDLLEVKQRIGF